MFCVVLFSSVTVINGFVSTPEQFAACRFIAGLGIGGVMPNVVALMNEYAPKKRRSTLVAIMFSGYSLGGILATVLGMLLMPTWGWSSVFYFAVVPLLLLPFLILQLPESINFLIRKGKTAQAQVLLAKAAPDYQPHPDDQLVIAQALENKATIPQLFQEGRAVNTLMLWIAFFCSLLMVYALSAWLPKLMIGAGYGLNSSLAFLLVLNAGAILGAIGGGWLGDRVGIERVLLGFFITGALALSLLALKSPILVLYLLIAVAGACTIGTQILANACAAQFYPAHIRSTGIGWALGIGRVGAIIGPVIGGSLVAAQLPIQTSFLAFAIPGAVGAVAMLVFLLKGPNPSRFALKTV